MIKKHATKISPEELQEKVMNAGTSWHHHCLSLKCHFNDTGQDIILLEAGDDIYYCESNKKLREELEEHMYQLNKSAGKKKKVKHEALDIIKEYVKKGTKWHFHITMPHCFLSMSDKYLLILENDKTSERQEWEFDKKPIRLVRQIDDFYLGRK